MNIFALDKDPNIAAIYHNNRHVVKMILETAQMISIIINDRKIVIDSSIKLPKVASNYRIHPCTKWMNYSYNNFVWSIKLGKALCNEYTFRYKKNHAYEPLYNYLIESYDSFLKYFNKDFDKLSKFALAMPDHCKLLNDEIGIESYRNYYKKEKRHIAQWKIREIPIWYN